MVSDHGGAVNGVILDRVYVKNDFDGVIYGVVYTHQQYSETRHFSPKEEHMYEYVVNMDENRSLGYASVYMPYESTECAVRGETMESNYTGQSAIVGGIREENGKSLAYIGSRVKPYGIRFCVTRIPYTLYSGEILLPNNNQEEQEESNNNQNEDEQEEESGEGSNEQGSTEVNESSNEEFGEVLGIKKLPKTGIGFNPVLVVFQIVCYYLLRRFII